MYISKGELHRKIKLWFHIWNQNIYLQMIRNSLQAALLIFTFISKLMHSFFDMVINPRLILNCVNLLDIDLSGHVNR